MKQPISQFITPTRRERLLRVACVLALIALGLIVWSLVDPRPLPVLVGLSIGQGLGTLSFLAYLIIIAADLHIRRKLRE